MKYLNNVSYLYCLLLWLAKFSNAYSQQGTNHSHSQQITLGVQSTPNPHDLKESSSMTPEYCEEGEVNDFGFPKTAVGNIALSTAKCEPGDYSFASIMCDHANRNGIQVAQFMNTTYTITNCDQTMDEIMAQTVANPSSENLKSAIEQSYIRITGTVDLTSDEVENMIDIFAVAETQAQLGHFQIEASTTLRYMVATVTEMMQRYSSFILENDKMRIQLARIMPNTCMLSQFSNNQRRFEAKNSYFAIEVVDHNQFEEQDVIFSPVLNEDDDKATSPLSLLVPRSAIVNAGSYNSNSSIPVRTGFAYYNDSFLFPSEGNALNVLSVNIGLNDSANANLIEPIVMTHFNVIEKPGKKAIEGTRRLLNQTKLSCVFWDFNTSTWLSEGCELSMESGVPVCRCHHLTNFALLVTYETVLANFVLTIASTVGCCLSILGLFFTILLLIKQRELRKHKPGKILLQLCCNLFISYIIFVTGVPNAIGNTAGCTTVTFLLHYFLLVTWFWMGIYSYEMYREVIQVFNAYCAKFMTKVSVVAYGVPVLIASITILVTSFLNQYDKSENTAYFSDHACWLTGLPLKIGFLVPVGVILVFNLVVFCAVVVELKRKTSKKSHAGRSRHSPRDLLMIAVTTTFLMGLTWIFGYLLMVARSDFFMALMSWLFAVSTSFQGFIIFMLTIVRHKKTRRMFWNSFRGLLRGSTYSYSNGSSSFGSSTPRTGVRRTSTGVTGLRP